MRRSRRAADHRSAEGPQRARLRDERRAGGCLAALPGRRRPAGCDPDRRRGAGILCGRRSARCRRLLQDTDIGRAPAALRTTARPRWHHQEPCDRQADHRRREWLLPGRWPRDRPRVRSAHRLRERELRPAGGDPRHHSRSGWNPAPSAPGWAGTRSRPDPDGPPHRRGRGGAHRPGDPRGSAGRSTAESARDGDYHRAERSAGRASGQGRRLAGPRCFARRGSAPRAVARRARAPE